MFCLCLSNPTQTSHGKSFEELASLVTFKTVPHSIEQRYRHGLQIEGIDRDWFGCAKLVRIPVLKSTLFPFRPRDARFQPYAFHHSPNAPMHDVAIEKISPARNTNTVVLPRAMCSSLHSALHLTYNATVGLVAVPRSGSMQR